MEKSNLNFELQHRKYHSLQVSDVYNYLPNLILLKNYYSKECLTEIEEYEIITNDLFHLSQ